jgi:hypothetical protein
MATDDTQFTPVVLLQLVASSHERSGLLPIGRPPAG